MAKFYCECLKRSSKGLPRINRGHKTRDSSKLRITKNDELRLWVQYAIMLNAACSIFLNAETIFLLSFELKKTSEENFRVVSKL